MLKWKTNTSKYCRKPILRYIIYVMHGYTCDNFIGGGIIVWIIARLQAY